MDDLVKTARRAKGSDLLPKVSFGTMNAETLILRMADRIEEMEAALDSAEIEHGMTSNGNLWRFWSKRACDTAKQNSALEVENARLRGALEVFADDTNWFDATEDNIRYPAWRGSVDDPEEFARATLAEKEKSDD